MNYPRLLLFLFSALLTTYAHGQIYKWIDENGRTQFSDKPHESAQEIIIKGSNKKESGASTKKSNTNQDIKIKHKSILNSNIVKLRSLLQKKEFKALNKAISELDASYKSNKISEDAFFTAYEAFDIKNESLSPLFDSWVTTTPDSYQPYLARAIFQYHMGWLSRGTKWASETKEEQKNKLADHLTKASDDIITALNINSDSIISYFYLMRITTTQGRNDETERLMRKALEIDPSSYNIRAQYLKSLTPRWGGSLEAMQAFISESSVHINNYPDLKSLEAYIYNEAGDMQALVNKYNVADTLYSKGLEFGEYHVTFFKRGKNNNRREEYKESLQDLNKAIELNYEKPNYYYWRAVTLIDMKEYKKAMSDIQYATLLDPYDKDIQNKRKWLAAKFENQAYKSKQSQKPESAVEKYTSAIRLNPQNATLYHGRARAYIQQRNLDLALVDLKKAIDIDPHEINNYSLIDYVLAKSKNWNQIIKYWDQFIELHPDNGRAYVERGGAYFHKGDIKSAVKNAKISADLGNLEGIEAYDKFKGMVQ